MRAAGSAHRLTPPLGKLMLRVIAGMVVFPALIVAQEQETVGATVTGRVADANSQPVEAVEVTIEGTTLHTITDADGRYVLLQVPAGPQTLRTRRIGYAPSRVSVVVPLRGTLTQDISIASSALLIEGIVVTADPLSRAKDELGTASVIDREAIANQAAVSLMTVMELIPGTPLTPPGLENVQQIALRSVPMPPGGSSSSVSGSAPTTAEIAAFGTLIVLDGVPLSNNANLQTLGPRGEVGLGTSAGGGVDLRLIPASMLERVEVIRGIPSARYGDLTQGAVIVETRAGIVDPQIAARYDGITGQANLLAGTSLFGETQLATGSFDVARTTLAPGLRDDVSYRISAQGAHRFGLARSTREPNGRVTFDTRVDFVQLIEDVPERPEIQQGVSSQNRDSELSISERVRFSLGELSFARLTAAVRRGRQRSFTNNSRFRAAMPFTDRLTEGRADGHYIGGTYISNVTVEGNPWLIFGRLEGTAPTRLSALDLDFVGGLEFRREWNDGPGYQFDIEFPPQVSFNGVNGFDRPRSNDAVPGLAAGALYVDVRTRTSLFGSWRFDLQTGLRLDILNEGETWFSGVRDRALQPRINLELAPVPWVRLRGGWGMTAKIPPLAQLYPAPQYYDVVNVNWYTVDPAERKAVLTTSIKDPTNPELGFIDSREGEVGLELQLGPGLGVISLVAFSQNLTGGIGNELEPTWLAREHYALADSTNGTGVPPEIVEPAYLVDTVPVLVSRPTNMISVNTKGLEVTAFFPEIRAINMRFEVQAQWIREQLVSPGLDFGNNVSFDNFQLTANIPRVPYWEGLTQKGERALVTYRVVHHQPRLGLVITGTLQHYVKETRETVGGSDSLSFAGYLTRAGTLVPVPPEDRTDPQYDDIRVARTGIFNELRTTPQDWLFSLQVSKTLPLDGRLSFYAYNAFFRQGNWGGREVIPRAFAAMRFGIELTMPLAPRSRRLR